MPASTADRNLLLGILALQLDFIDREQLIKAMHAWVIAKTRTLSEILVEQGGLAAPQKALLEALVDEHLRQHGNDTAKSLESVKGVGRLAEELRSLHDTDLEASLGHLATRNVGNVEETLARPDTPAPSAPVRYRVLRPHARGGLGKVSVAQDEELCREVALKELHSRHADDAESRHRFVLEARITGGLEHPGIVPVYGLGQYADGRPFYAMRFIRGDSLKEAIGAFHSGAAGSLRLQESARILEFRQLLGRFIDVCNAMQYAHSRGVLHRDLKPGNIMLGKYGETLVVDWGLAKPLGRAEGSTHPEERTLRPPSDGGSTPTQMGSAVGTPAYMSPEQASGRHDLLGPASDVYSLGATLYHLLTGLPPQGEGPLEDILHRVEEGDFPLPRALRPDLPRALEAICLKAMALSPPERYPSPGALADDLEHWLADEPVSAYLEPMPVRMRRWLARHRTLVTAGAASVLVALASLAAATGLLASKNSELKAANEREQQAAQDAQRERAEAQKQRDEALRQERRAAEERDRAQANFKLAQDAVDRYFTRVSEDRLLGEPNMKPLRRELLATAIDFLLKFVADHAGDPELEDELAVAYVRLGSVTAEEGILAEALEHYLKAKSILDRRAPRNPASQGELAKVENALAVLYRSLGRDEESTQAVERAQAIWKERHGDERMQAVSLATQGVIQHTLGAYQGAAETFRKALAMQEQILEDSDDYADWAAVAVTCNALAINRQTVGESAEAEKLFLRIVEIWDRICERQPENPFYEHARAVAIISLARFLVQQGRAIEAEALYRRALGTFETLLKDDRHSMLGRMGVSQAQNDLGELDLARLRYDEALEHLTAALEVRRALAADNPDSAENREAVAVTLTLLAQLHLVSGRAPAAQSAHREALSLRTALVADFPSAGQHRQSRIISLANLASLHEQQGEHEEAIKLCREIVAEQKWLSERSPRDAAQQGALAQSQAALGRALLSDRKLDEAEAELKVAYQVCRALADQFPNDHAHGLRFTQVILQLAALAWARGRPEEAERSLEEAHGKLQELHRRWPHESGLAAALADSHYRLAALRQGQGRLVESEAEHRRAAALLAALAEAFPDSAAQQRAWSLARQHLAQALASTGRVIEAEAEFNACRELRRQLSERFPQALETRIDLILANCAYAEFLAGHGRRDEATDAFLTALAQMKRFAEESVAAPECRQALANVHVRVARHFATAQQYALAESHLLQALDLSERLHREQPADGRNRYGLAQAKKFLGAVHSLTDRLATARTLLEEALALETQLARETPHEIVYQTDLALTHQQLGYVHSAGGRAAEARLAYESAQRIWRELVAKSLPGADHRAGQAAALGELARFEMNSGNLDAAEAPLQEALSIHKSLLAVQKTAPAPTRNLALAHKDLAAWRLARGEAEAADAEFRQALDLLEPLAAAQPQVDQYALDVAQIRFTAGLNAQLSNRLAISIEQFDKALAVLTQVLARNQQHAEARRLLSQVHAGRAVSYSDTGRYEDAVRDYDLALEHDLGPDRDGLQIMRAGAVAHLGRYREAAVEVERRLAKENLNGGAFYNAGVAYAIAAGQARQDAKLPSAERARLAEEYAGAAMLNLKKAQVAGFLRLPVSRERLATHPDLAPLRERADYKRLLEELKAEPAAAPRLSL